MGTRRLMTLTLLGTLAATPALAQEARPRRPEPDRNRDRHEEPRTRRDGRDAQRSREYERRDNDGRENDRRDSYRRDNDRRDNDRRYEAARPDVRRYDERYAARRRPYYDGHRYVYPSRTVIVPRIIRPRIVTVVPWRPYVYRPSIGIGIYYGADGYYPYGYTPEAYYDPQPGRIYGGVRIVDAPRDAQVFADGYYVGIVDDFDGVFQHMNLEPGEHHIEIQDQGQDPIAFDVMVQPGQTLTLRAGQ